jgi:HK97 family phage portal protein
MGILDLFRRKRQDTPDTYFQSSLSVLDRSGRAKAQPFSYGSAVRMYSSWIYAAASINAQAVASVPLRLYVKSRPGRKLYDTRRVPRARKAYLCGDAAHQPSRLVMRKALAGDFEEVAFEHPVLEVLRKANTVDDGFGLAMTRILFLELTGNAYLHPVFDSALDIPVELWTMPSQHVKVIPSTDGLIAGYRYGTDQQTEQDFGLDEVIHFRRPNPKSLLYGMGKLEAAWGVAQQNEAIHEMDLSFFENNARPDYAVIVKGGAGREQLERFETKIREALQGTRKAGKFFAVTGDVEMRPLSFPTKDLSGRDEIVEEIAAVFGVPVSMLKANDPNLAAAKSGYAQWRESTVAPICRLDEETLNAKLLPMFGLEDDAYLAYDNPVPADRTQDLVERQTSVAGGWMTPNEARLEAGYDPMPDPAADRLYVGGQPLGASAQAPNPFGGLFGAQGSPQSAPRQLPPAVEPADDEAATEPVQASKRLEAKPEPTPEQLQVAQEAQADADARRVAKAAYDIAAQIDRTAQDEDGVKIARLMDAVEKGYMREITDDETIRYALEGAIGEVDRDISAVLKAYGLDRDTQVASASTDLDLVTKAVGTDALDAAADEIELTLKRHAVTADPRTILKGNT